MTIQPACGASASPSHTASGTRATACVVSASAARAMLAMPRPTHASSSSQPREERVLPATRREMPFTAREPSTATAVACHTRGWARPQAMVDKAQVSRVMPMIHRDVLATVGNTPLVALERVSRDLPGRIVAKLEMRNPCGSVKDRVGLALIEDAERRGILRPGAVLV